MVHIIIPAGGIGSRFSSYGFKTQKFLLPVDSSGSTMIEMAIKTLNAPRGSKYTFITQASYINQELIGSLKNFDCKWVLLNKITEGPASTVIEGLNLYDLDEPLLVSNSDQILENWDCSLFLEKCREFDGGVLTYTPPYEVIVGTLDKHSYVQLDDEGKCIKFAEKKVLSKQALVGVHYFKSGKVFMDAYRNMVEHNERSQSNGEFYLSLLYNAILRLGGTVCAVPLQQNERFHPTGEPVDYFKYINNVSQFCPVKMETFSVEDKKLKIYLNDGSLESEAVVVFLDGPRYGEIILGPVTNEGKTLVIEYNFNPLLHGVVPSCWSLEDMYRGWFIGNFEPNVFRTQEFEVGILTHKKGEVWPFHIHDHSEEYNYLLNGRMVINGVEYNKGDSFMFPRGVLACPSFLEDCTVICVKVPSNPMDKRIV
jgi:NDP-sugar pyrophosphorylase family protein/mannose-6-phosphate isomerase-like protein (cupin superfamily)